MENLRDELGLPDSNTGEYLSVGKVKDWTGVETRPALPLDGNMGGAPEHVFPNPEQQIEIISTHGLTP